LTEKAKERINTEGTESTEVAEKKELTEKPKERINTEDTENTEVADRRS